MTIRVLQISKEFQPLSSGVARHIQGLAQALSDDPAIELRLMAPVMDSAAAPCPTQPGGYRALWQQLGNCNVVHLHGARTPFVAAAAALAWLRRCPVVYTPHCYYDTGSRWQRRLKRGWDRTVERALVRKAGAVVLLHDGWRDDLARRGLHPRRIVTVPNCINERRDGLAPSALHLEGQPALLSIGRLDPIKRLDDVIAALGQPELCSAILHVVGQGPDRARLEAVAQGLGVAERVRFHGWQDDAATNNMMMGCDAMVLASAREGMPTVVLEALLAGVPIACSDIDGNRAILTAVGWDATFALGDIAALARCAARTAKREVPSEVRQTVRSRFTWGGQAPCLAVVYRDLAGASR